jgi:hypothetical protein
MKIEKEQIEYIKNFAKMYSREDFFDLLNYTKPFFFVKDTRKS